MNERADLPYAVFSKDGTSKLWVRFSIKGEGQVAVLNFAEIGAFYPSAEGKLLLCPAMLLAQLADVLVESPDGCHVRNLYCGPSPHYPLGALMLIFDPVRP